MRREGSGLPVSCEYIQCHIIVKRWCLWRDWWRGYRNQRILFYCRDPWVNVQLVAGENVLLGGNLMWREEKREYKHHHTHTNSSKLYIPTITVTAYIWNYLPCMYSCNMTPHTITHLRTLATSHFCSPPLLSAHLLLFFVAEEVAHPRLEKVCSDWAGGNNLGCHHPLAVLSSHPGWSAKES